MYIIADVPSNVSEELDKVIYAKDLKSANDDLAGHMQGEFDISHAKKILYPFLLQSAVAHKDKYPEFFRRAHSTVNFKSKTLDIYSLWVNFQYKYDFNPIHIHDGLYSFVIWHKIPFDIENEKARYPKTPDNEQRAGYFQFFYSGHEGQVLTEDIPADKKYEGKMAFFPANLNHCVYPFYTSDEPRITISGNLGFAI